MTNSDLKNSFSKICCIVYDIFSLKSLINFAKKHCFKFYYIRHDDFDENSDLKKRHWHFIIESDSKHRFNIKSLISENLPINLFKKLDSVVAYLRYMTHIDYVDKRHYSIKRIISNVSSIEIENMISNANLCSKEIRDNNFNEIVLLIIQGCFNSFTDILIYCNDNDIKYSTNWTFTFNLLLKEKKFN